MIWNLNREELISIRHLIIALDVDDCFQKAEGRVICKVHDSSTLLTCMPSPICEFTSSSCQVCEVTDTV